jgi:predicted O-methyltransferase YrrM
MGLSGKIKNAVNRWIAPLNIHLDSRTAERAEVARLLDLADSGHFAGPVFPILSQFLECDPMPLLQSIALLKEKTARFSAASGSEGYSFSNTYFTSPDAEVAYALISQLKPKRLIEVGSGNSTQLFRAAIDDGGLNTQLVSIDPMPRKSIETVAHRFINCRVERVTRSYLFETLDVDDVLFIDSSHEIRAANDVVNLLLNIIPRLKRGVVVHLHDIFLPFEYPREWIIENRWDWNEQYLVQALLQGSTQFAVLWPGYYLQRNLAGFSDYFDQNPCGRASSLWLRKIE